MADTFFTLTRQISFSKAKALDARFGPYSSVAEAYAEVGPEGFNAITAGLPFGIRQADGSVEIYIWTKDKGSATDYKKLVPDSSNGIIVIAGIKTSGTPKTGSTTITGDAGNIYYYSQLGVFGLSLDGGATYYKRWTNEKDFGEYTIFDPNYSSGNYSGNLAGVTAYNNRLYLIASTGELKLGTNSEIDSLGNFTTAQKNAINSGITEEMVEYIRELMEGSVTPTTSYSIKSFNFSYPSTVSASGATGTNAIALSSFRVVCDKQVGSTTTEETFNSLTEFNAIGGIVTFDLSDTDVDNVFSIGLHDGRLTVAANSTTSTRETKVVAVASIGESESEEIKSNYIIQAAAETQKLSISSVSYNITENNDTYTATPTIVASDGNNYTVAQYNATTHEDYTIEMPVFNGLTTNSSTGVMSWNRNTLLDNLTAGTILSNFVATFIETINGSDIYHYGEATPFDYSQSEATGVFNAWTNKVGSTATKESGTSGFELRTNVTNKSHAAPNTITNVNAGDIYYFKLTDDSTGRGSWAWLFETSTPVVENGAVVSGLNDTYQEGATGSILNRGFGSSNVHKFVIYKVQQGTELTISTYLDTRKPLFYKKLN